MRVKDFVSEILAEMASLPCEETNLDVLIRLESQFALNDLKLLLHKSSADENKITLAKMKEFCALLSERWYYIKHTDSCYPHHPHTRANRAYLILAEAVSKQVNEEIYTLLMPTVGAIAHPTSRNNLSCFRLHEFVLGDDGTPIEVAKCLDEATQHKTDILFHTGGLKRPLSEAEKQRVINHSVEASQYYDALQFYLKTGIDNDLKPAHKILHEVLTSDDCSVTATYGEGGRSRLTKSILTRVKSQEDFMKLMVAMPQRDWQDFIKDMDTKDLCRYILNDDSFINALQKPSSYSLNETHNKAFLFCISEIYKRERLCDSEFRNRWGYFTSMSKKYLGDYSQYLQSYTKEEKIAAVDILQNFLLSKHSLSNFETYLNESAIVEHKGPLFEVGSDLAWITHQLNLVADANFFQQNPIGLLAKILCLS